MSATEYGKFSIIDKATGEKLATLPTTIPIGLTVDGFERAGYEVTWTWEEKIMRTTSAPTIWSEEDIVIWENMDATTKREFVLSSAFSDVRKKPSEWLNNKIGETK